jgi:L-threonylcarbamoyladenylate synthase
MKILKIDLQNPNINAIKNAAQVIKAGGVVIYPTDTCYGIGASALDTKAIKKIIDAKSRNFQRPFSVIVKDIKMAKELAEINNKQEKYFKSKLPGRFTLVLEKRKKLPAILTAGLPTIGIRIPNHVATKLLSDFLSIPYITTSANIVGQKPAYGLDELAKQFNNKKIDLILDAGQLPKHKVSTVIDLSGQKVKILRA